MFSESLLNLQNIYKNSKIPHEARSRIMSEISFVHNFQQIVLQFKIIRGVANIVRLLVGADRVQGNGS